MTESRATRPLLLALVLGVAVLVAGLAAALAPAVAGAATSPVIEVGPRGELASPSCPEGPCLAVSRTTGYQVRVDDRRGGWVVPEHGRLVAFTIKLGSPSQEQIDFFNENLGGTSQARLAVMRPRKARRNRPHPIYRRLVRQSPVFRLDRYFGQTVTFPLDDPMPVRKGYVIGLTVPTWAPALAVGLDRKTSWRASRNTENDGCEDVRTQTAAQSPGQMFEFRCLYSTAELTFSATLVPLPTPNRTSDDNETEGAEDDENGEEANSATRTDRPVVVRRTGGTRAPR